MVRKIMLLVFALFLVAVSISFVSGTTFTVSDFTDGTDANTTSSTAGVVLQTNVTSISAANLVLWFNKSSDISGNGYSPAVQGNAKSNYSWTEYDGNDDAYYQDVRLVHNYPFTMCSWFRGQGGTNLVMFDLGYLADTNYMWLITVRSGAIGMLARYLSAYNIFETTAATYNEKLWHHVCGSFNASNTKVLYVDGQRIGVDTSYNVPDANLAQTDTYSIGAVHRSASWPDDFLGQINHVIMYNTSFDDASYQGLYRKGLFYGQGSYTYTFDMTYKHGNFQISWVESLLSQTDITFRARVSNDSSTWSEWSPSYTISGSQVTGVPTGRYIQVEATLTTLNTTKTPELKSLTVDTGCVYPEDNYTLSSAGETVVFCKGEYNAIDQGESGGWDGFIRLRNGADNLNITCEDNATFIGNRKGYFILTNSSTGDGSYRNLYIEGCKAVNYSSSMALAYVPGADIRNYEADSGVYEGIYLDRASNVTIRNYTARNFFEKDGLSHGIYFQHGPYLSLGWRRNITITDSYFENIVATLVFSGGGVGYMRNMTAKNNTFYNCTTAFVLSGCLNCTITNNSFENISETGFNINWQSGNVSHDIRTQNVSISRNTFNISSDVGANLAVIWNGTRDIKFYDNDYINTDKVS